MATSYSIGKHFEGMIESLIESGRYSTASEIMREGLRLVEEREERRKAKLEALRAEIQKGFDSGPAEEIDLDELIRGHQDAGAAAFGRADTWRIRFHKPAQVDRDLDAIWSYIAADNVRAADKLLDRIGEVFAMLVTNAVGWTRALGAREGVAQLPGWKLRHILYGTVGWRRNRSSHEQPTGYRRGRYGVMSIGIGRPRPRPPPDRPGGSFPPGR